ncbi:MAG: sulfate ABC transporter substrate-binding protein [Pseudanabaenaceae cyanobacterium bins.68]|nr:sulfate ABC transporter substrate-binding protein [Pseudanabaenaceae cyanobacterium bins.68]
MFSWRSLLGIAVMTLSLIIGINHWVGMTAPTTEVTLVSYAVTKVAYQAIIPKFVAKWKADTGETVKFITSYGASGSQTRAIIDGLEADIANLALGLDMDKLVASQLLAPNWSERLPNQAIVTTSAIAIATREGNPHRIQTWQDLTKPNLQVITANPKTSGVARWNFLGLWFANASEPQKYLTQVFRNVPILPRDAREASDVFLKQGQGDVLLNYENELILANQQGYATSYLVPEVNVAIEAPVAVIDRVVDRHGNRRAAEAFVQYLFAPEAQKEFAKTGFRPVNPQVAEEFQPNFPTITKLFKVGDLGGWQPVNQRFFAENAIFDQILNQRK